VPRRSGLNGIDLWDVKRATRFEQGFTYELNLSGVADELRDEFAAEQGGRNTTAAHDRRQHAPPTRPPATRPPPSRSRQRREPRQRITEDAAIASLSDGMTIGIGGWGSRRKPMSLVRAVLRSPLQDLTIVSSADRMSDCSLPAGKIRRIVYGFVSLDSIALEPHWRAARQSGSIPEPVEYDEGMLQWRCTAG